MYVAVWENCDVVFQIGCIAVLSICDVFLQFLKSRSGRSAMDIAVWVICDVIF